MPKRLSAAVCPRWRLLFVCRTGTSEGAKQGGWAFRYGRETIAGDKFALGDVFDTGAMLIGRRTWQLFAKIWPGRNDEFSAKMNAIPKLVVSRSLEQADAWQNSAVLRGDLITEV